MVIEVVFHAVVPVMPPDVLPWEVDIEPEDADDAETPVMLVNMVMVDEPAVGEADMIPELVALTELEEVREDEDVGLAVVDVLVPDCVVVVADPPEVVVVAVECIGVIVVAPEVVIDMRD